jgi:protein-tyrosine phosphatase
VLVHCQSGISRSTTIVLAFIIKKLKMPLELANRLVVWKRDIAAPN